jgi:sporulation protein YlmC with PRC-barrel domain
MRTFALAAILAPAFAFGAMAQGTATTPPAPQIEQPATPPAATTAPAANEMALSEEQVKTLVGKPVYSNDGKNLGEVVAFARGDDNVVTEMHADIGGFLGLGETRVKVMPAQIQVESDRVIIDMTAAAAKDLPKVE